MNLSKQIVLVEVEKLYPYHNNPKEHPPEQIDKIASSIKNYGFIQPLVIDGDNEVIIGHGRLEASKKLGLDKVPVVVKQDLSDAEVRALRIADNRIAESDWNMEQLTEELELLEMDNIPLEDVGFDQDEIEAILEFPDIIDNSGNEDDRSNRTSVSKSSMVVSIGTITSILDYDFVQEVMAKIGEQFTGEPEEKVKDFLEWYLYECD